MIRENAAAKGIRYLTEGRLTILSANGRRVEARVRVTRATTTPSSMMAPAGLVRAPLRLDVPTWSPSCGCASLPGSAVLR